METLRVGVAGAPRGMSLSPGLEGYGSKVEISCVYDPDPGARDAVTRKTGIATVSTFEQLLDGSDALIVASPQQYHAPQAVMALERGVHVLSEVPAAVSLAQATLLVGAARNSGCVYMLAENYCYTRENLTVAAMAREGLFGNLYFGEGQYLHEMKGWHRDAEGRPTWRYYWQVGRAGNTYPTHSIGPLLQCLEDRVVSVACAGSGRHTDPEHEIDDTVLMWARTRSGALLDIRLDLLSNRPHLFDYYSLQGTGGAYEAARSPGESAKVYIEGKSPGGEWEPLEAYTERFLPERYQHPVAGAGHWGADTWPVRGFVDAILGHSGGDGIDLYRGLDMTLPGIMSELSFRRGGAWVEVPDPRLWDSGIGAEPGRGSPLD